jgi:hypothetical protein
MRPTTMILLLAALVAPARALAGQPITELPNASANRDTVMGPDGLPDPHRAAMRSVSYTLVPIGVGTGMFAVGVGAAISDYGRSSTTDAAWVAVIGAGLATAGVVFGPSAGYHYGDLDGRAAAGVALRLGALVVPAAVAWSDSQADAGSIVLAGVVVAVGSAVADIAMVEGAVARHNASRRRPVSWRVAPARTPTTHAPAVALELAFGGH